MKLKALLNGLDFVVVKGNIANNFTNIVDHSKDVIKGSIYVCIKGYKTDGHEYISDAIEKGASVIVVENRVNVMGDVTVIRCENTRKMLAELACRYYNYPTKHLTLIGVTGTNGKTSTAYLIRNILMDFGLKVGLISTIENIIGHRHIKAQRTTENSLQLQKIFAMMVKEGTEYVVMEVSSHALDLYRVYGCDFNISVFTNLSHDHLDFHKSIENYRNAKLKLFKMNNTSIINVDDLAGIYMLNNGKSKLVMTYGCNNSMATINAINIKSSIKGSAFDCIVGGEKYPIQIQTPGKFSVYNALAAIGVSYSLDIPFKSIKDSLENHSRIKGRFQPIISPKGYSVIVDYAHTPDGLIKVLDTINEFKNAKVITVFGCGGDRDKSKREVMGKIASEKSDYIIVTSDNPRTEDPDAIIEDIRKGIKNGFDSYEIIADRKEAIIKALQVAREDDIVLVAGKGHEDYQIIGNESHHFDDIEIVNKHI